VIWGKLKVYHNWSATQNLTFADTLREHPTDKVAAPGVTASTSAARDLLQHSLTILTHKACVPLQTF
jgi:hypothetical protein